MQQSTKCQKSPMEQSLLLPTSRFTKIRNKQFVKAVMVITAIVAAIVIWDEYPNIKPRIAPERHSLFGKVPFYVGGDAYPLQLLVFDHRDLGSSKLTFQAPYTDSTGDGCITPRDKDYEESKRKTKINTGMSYTMIMMVTLLCATCSGIKPSISPIKERRLYVLTVSIGVATVAFGLIYFIIGAVIMVELAGGLVSPSPIKCESKSKEGDTSQRSGPDATTIV